MEKIKLWTMCCLSIIGLLLSSCSSSDDNDGKDDGGFNISQLVGSEWQRNYYNINDDGWEKGDCLLTFISGNQVSEEITYHGEGIFWNPESDEDEYKSYSGTNTSFYSYRMNGTTLVFTDEYGGNFNVTISGNKMRSSNGDEWTLTKAGTGSGDDKSESGGSTTTYSWSNMQGVWMKSTYEAYLSTINTYISQNATSDVFLNNHYDGDFGVSGYQFNSSGAMKDIYASTRTWHNDDALIFKTIYTSDNKTVYWTDIENDSYSDRLTISGDKIYYNGNVRFEIFDSTKMFEGETLYVKVK